jgi:hypothetical protein
MKIADFGIKAVNQTLYGPGREGLRQKIGAAGVSIHQIQQFFNQVDANTNIVGTTGASMMAREIKGLDLVRGASIKNQKLGKIVNALVIGPQGVVAQSRLAYEIHVDPALTLVLKVTLGSESEEVVSVPAPPAVADTLKNLKTSRDKVSAAWAGFQASKNVRDLDLCRTSLTILHRYLGNYAETNRSFAAVFSDLGDGARYLQSSDAKDHIPTAIASAKPKIDACLKALEKLP